MPTVPWDEQAHRDLRPASATVPPADGAGPDAASEDGDGTALAALVAVGALAAAGGGLFWYRRHGAHGAD